MRALGAIGVLLRVRYRFVGVEMLVTAVEKCIGWNSLFVCLSITVFPACIGFLCRSFLPQLVEVNLLIVKLAPSFITQDFIGLLKLLEFINSRGPQVFILDLIWMTFQHELAVSGLDC
jgi:hypothetical protein